MGITCSLLGHQFDEPERIEEREEQGSEVILAIKEVKRCERCQHTITVSESKEVTAIDTTESESLLDDPVEDFEAKESIPSDEHVETDTIDDGVILEDDPTERKYGEWPVNDRATTDEKKDSSTPSAWPTVKAEDEGYDAVVGGMTDEDAGTEIEFVGLTPSAKGPSSGTGAEVVEDTEPTDQSVLTAETVAPEELPDATGTSFQADSDDGFTRAGSIDAHADRSRNDVETEYYCPRCDFVKRSINAPVRAGDICPSCRKGYLGERHVR